MRYVAKHIRGRGGTSTANCRCWVHERERSLGGLVLYSARACKSQEALARVSTASRDGSGESLNPASDAYNLAAARWNSAGSPAASKVAEISCISSTKRQALGAARRISRSAAQKLGPLRIHWRLS